MILLGLDLSNWPFVFLGRGMRVGKLGDGGGENSRWLKLNREEVADRGPRS